MTKNILFSKNILFQESAVKEVLQHLKTKGYKWYNINYTNKKRYCIVRGDPNIAIMLKTDPFFNFGYEFKHLGEKGVGDGINCEHLKRFITLDVEDIYTMFKDGKIYTIKLKDFLLNSHKAIQKEGTEIRYISIHHYRRVNKDDKENN